eukprot:1153231-Pelagomonas_calceolata.AAC.2
MHAAHAQAEKGKKRKEKQCRQRELSLHQLRRRRGISKFIHLFIYLSFRDKWDNAGMLCPKQAIAVKTLAVFSDRTLLQEPSMIR